GKAGQGQFPTDFASELIVGMPCLEAGRAEHGHCGPELAQPFEAALEFRGDSLETSFFALGRSPLRKEIALATSCIRLRYMQLIGSKADFLPMPLPGLLPGIDRDRWRLVLFIFHRWTSSESRILARTKRDFQCKPNSSS